MGNSLKICVILVIAAMFFISSCRLSYVPSALYVPLHEQKGEIYSQASLGNNGLGAHLSYSVFNNISIMAGGNVLRDELLDHYSYEGGIGFFESYENDLVFETFAGAGYGYTEKLPDQTMASVSTHGVFTKAFLQPAIGFKSDNWETGLGLRVSYVDYESYLKPPIHNFQRMFFEPALSAKYGWRSLKFSLQVGSSIALGQLPPDLDFYPAFFNVGLLYQYKPGK